MHTFLKREDGRFDVGMWLMNREGYHQFSRIAHVESLAEALMLVSYLNGGQYEGIDTDWVKWVHAYD